MVIKIIKEEIVSYFEYDTFHVERVYDENKNIIEMGDAWRIVSKKTKESKEPVNVKIIRGVLNEKSKRLVVTDRVCYILGSSGKTIDTI